MSNATAYTTSRWAGRAKVSPAWYLAWPGTVFNLAGASSPTTAMWSCFAGPRRIVEHVPSPIRRSPRLARTYVVDQCSAPPGIRCSCGTQLAGHDPGDEG